MSLFCNISNAFCLNMTSCDSTMSVMSVVFLRPIEPQDIVRANRMMYAESLLALALGLAVRLLFVL